MHELQPQLGEFFRTCVHPASLLLQIAHIEDVDIKHGHPEQLKNFNETHRYASKFVLTDGHLMVQALLHRKLGGLKDVGDLREGDFLDIKRSELRRAPRVEGHGKVVYLVVEDCHFLLQPDRPTQTAEQIDQPVGNVLNLKRKRGTDAQSRINSSQSDKEGIAGGFLRSSPKKLELEEGSGPRLAEREKGLEDIPSTVASMFGSDINISQDEIIHILAAGNSKVKRDEGEIAQQNGTDSAKRHAGSNVRLGDEESEEDAFFEKVTLDEVAIAKRRKVLLNLDQIASPHPTAVLSNAPTPAGSGRCDRAHVEPVLDYPERRAQASLMHDRRESETAMDLLLKELNEEPEKERPPLQSALSPAPKYAHSRYGTLSLSQPPPPLDPGRPGLAKQSFRDIATTLPGTILPAPPFHELGNLRHPPPSRPLPTKNYILTTLAIVSWTGTSLLHKPGSPFPPKRHLKIIDPSLSSSRPQSRDGQASAAAAFIPQNAFQGALTVAVYIDAANFKPTAGTVALFRGLVMQRLGNGDVILNAYARLKDQRFEECKDVRGEYAIEPLPEDDSPFESHWFITNHNKIRALGYGSLLDYYVGWWNDRRRSGDLVR